MTNGIVKIIFSASFIYLKFQIDFIKSKMIKFETNIDIVYCMYD